MSSDPLFTNAARVNVANHDVNSFGFIYDSSLSKFRPLTAGDFSADSYTTSLQVIRSGDFTVPAGVHSWSLTVESGAAYINGVGPYNAGATQNGGGYGGFRTISAINVGITGGHAYLSYEYVA